MAVGSVHIGGNVQTFKSSPKFDVVDMVILNIDENTYVSSPYVKINTVEWEASKLGKSNGKYVFTYDAEAGVWKLNSSEANLSSYGITVAYNVDSVGAKAGDTITVNRMGETATTENPSPDIQVIAELTRSGKTLEANCPLCKPANRQQIADNLLQSLSGYGYQPFQATGAEVNPLAELGDGLTVNWVYAGMYQQDLTFDQLMVSDIAAPYEEELESEYSYEDSSERTYRRKFADIAAEFEIHSDEIAARVTREGTGDGFSWSLVETGFSVKAGDKVIFRVDKDGTYTDGTGEFSGKIIGGSIKIGEYFSVDKNGYLSAKSGKIGCLDIYSGHLSTKGLTWYSTQEQGFYVGDEYGLKLGNKFKVDISGNLECSSAKVTGGSIEIGDKFSVDAYGNLECSSAKITGGSISIGNKFSVDINGNLQAASGTFEGNVYAKNINYNGDAGFFNGAGVATNSVDSYRFDTAVRTTLGRADHAYGVTQGWYDAQSLAANSMHTVYFYLNGSNVTKQSVTVMNSSGGTTEIQYLKWWE